MYCGMVGVDTTHGCHGNMKLNEITRVASVKHVSII